MAAMVRAKVSPVRIPVAVVSIDKSVVLFLLERGKEDRLVLAKSKDGNTFAKKFEAVSIVSSTGKKENIALCRDFKIYSGEKGLTMTYIRHGRIPKLVFATGKSPKRFTIRGTLNVDAPGVFVNGGKKAESAIYFGKDVLKLAVSKTGVRFTIVEEHAKPYWKFFDGLPFQIAGAYQGDEGTYVVCASTVTEEILRDVNRGQVVGEAELCRIGIALFSKENPRELVWHTQLPFMDKELKHQDFKVLGLVSTQAKKETSLRMYFVLDGQLHYFEFPYKALEHKRAYVPLLLSKVPHNPILSPTDNFWEQHSVMNPAALHIDNSVHILYRAIGPDGVSRLGYASSSDGTTITLRHEVPAFALEKPRATDPLIHKYSPVMYPSGGSWGGCEDPRMVRIEDKVYMTFNMFDGWDRLRVAVVWINVEDFLAKKFWKWSEPFFLSPEGQVHKNWILFPEKINGAFALLHNLHGDEKDRVRIEYVDDLLSFKASEDLQSPDPNAIADRPTAWHKRMRSAGPPPLKTKEGWLLFYHATDRYEPKRYKLGVMLLDLNDPSKILHRANASILNPDEYYENNGKPGIVYACGAVEIEGEIFVYYGGADRVACVATVKTEDLLQHIMKHKDARFVIHNVTL